MTELATLESAVEASDSGAFALTAPEPVARRIPADIEELIRGYAALMNGSYAQHSGGVERRIHDTLFAHRHVRHQHAAVTLPGVLPAKTFKAIGKLHELAPHCEFLDPDMRNRLEKLFGGIQFRVHEEIRIQQATQS